MPNRRHIQLALAAVAVGLVITALILGPTEEWLTATIEWVDQAGATGIIAFFAIFAIATMLFLPVALFLAASGFLFGAGGGFLIASLATTVGAMLTFVVGRYLLRDPIQNWTDDSPRLQALDRAITRESGKMALLTRLVPILPFAAINYTFSVSAAPFRRYVVGTWIGMLPITAVYVYTGAAAGDLTRALAMETAPGPATYLIWGAGLLAMGVVVWLITSRARRELAYIMETEEEE